MVNKSWPITLAHWVRNNKEILIKRKKQEKEMEKETDEVLWGIPIELVRDPSRVTKIHQWKQKNSVWRFGYPFRKRGYPI